MAGQDVVEETLTIVAEELDRESVVTAGSEADASWAEARRTHEELASREVQKHGGAEVGSFGSGYLFAFSSVRRAIACAVGIQRAVAERGQKSAGRLAVRIGVDCGEVLRD
jgi:adenylate cyclase